MTYKDQRTVHARRARLLRRRGEDVRFARWSDNGLAIYEWTGPLYRGLKRVYNIVRKA